MSASWTLEEDMRLLGLRHRVKGKRHVSLGPFAPQVPGLCDMGPGGCSAPRKFASQLRTPEPGQPRFIASSKQPAPLSGSPLQTRP